MDTTTTRTMLTVGAVAAASNCSVRTLHHYDEIGLLTPTGRSEAGYRLYSDDDVARLHQILVMRTLGLSLEAIKAALDDPHFNTVTALEEQLVQLDGEIGKLENVRMSVATMLTTIKRRSDMTEQNIAEIFDGFDPSDYEEEVKERWGDTDAFAQSANRTKNHSPQDWAKMKEQQDRIEANFAEALEAGLGADDTAVMDLAELHRNHIDKWFYDCSHETHVGLGEMYVADPRFAKHYSKRAEGLAAFVAEAINANAARG